MPQKGQEKQRIEKLMKEILMDSVRIEQNRTNIDERIRSNLCGYRFWRRST
ncbi:hypothetical protein [Candidatus Nitronereus thalassa]|uniref:Uncharacterized protein n=1 Tax=Candidatus Nitronereus thalassa TaxID=3020898 RepID=A0ABU3KAC7_9BACT|nr:hypothetical protein [Candidatus Nitronereus thalassa]MDT7043368.1 hypothetical protein [Candidatus Nitronereus thalassa]